MKKLDKIILTAVFILSTILSIAILVNQRNLSKALINFEQSVSDTLNFQTSLFYRTVGENIPIIVPVEKEIELQSIFDSLPEISSINKEKFENSFNLYSKYLTTTPPWIQEEQASSLFEIKFTLDFCSIVLNYEEKFNSVNYTIHELENFILMNGEYSRILDVKTYYDNLVQVRNSSILEKNAFLKNKITEMATDSLIEVDEVRNLIVQIKEQIEILDENLLYDDIEVFENAVIMLTEKEKNVLVKKQYEEYINDFNKYIIEIKNNINLQDLYFSLQERIPSIQYNFPGKHDEDDLILYEWTVFYNIKNNYTKIKQQLENLKEDIKNYNQYDFNILKNKVYNLAINTSQISRIGEQDLKEINKLVGILEIDIDKVEKLYIDYENRLFIKNFDEEFVKLKDNTLKGDFSLNTFNLLQSQLSTIMELYPDEYKNKNIEIEELKLYSEINDNLILCQRQIENIIDGDNKLNEIKIDSLSEQVNHIKYNLSLFKFIETNELNTKLIALTEELKNKARILEQKSINEEEKLIKKYNSQVISVLKKVNTENNRLNNRETFKSFSSTEKRNAIITGRMKLLSTLEKIDILFLYPSVYTLYNQIYGIIWSSEEGGTSFNMEEQFQIVNDSLTQKKWGLDDTFYDTF